MIFKILFFLLLTHSVFAQSNRSPSKGGEPEHVYTDRQILTHQNAVVVLARADFPSQNPLYALKVCYAGNSMECPIENALLDTYLTEGDLKYIVQVIRDELQNFEKVCMKDRLAAAALSSGAGAMVGMMGFVAQNLAKFALKFANVNMPGVSSPVWMVGGAVTGFGVAEWARVYHRVKLLKTEKEILAVASLMEPNSAQKTEHIYVLVNIINSIIKRGHLPCNPRTDVIELF